MYGIVELRSKACEQRSKQGYQDITAHSGLAVSNGGGWGDLGRSRRTSVWYTFLSWMQCACKPSLPPWTWRGSRVGLTRTVYIIYTVYDRIFGDCPVKILYIHRIMWFWPPTKWRALLVHNVLAWPANPAQLHWADNSSVLFVLTTLASAGEIADSNSSRACCWMLAMPGWSSGKSRLRPWISRRGWEL
jgi:hypothetical protein